jgi:hypothetical protein
MFSEAELEADEAIDVEFLIAYAVTSNVLSRHHSSKSVEHAIVFCPSRTARRSVRGPVVSSWATCRAARSPNVQKPGSAPGTPHLLPEDFVDRKPRARMRWNGLLDVVDIPSSE